MYPRFRGRVRQAPIRRRTFVNGITAACETGDPYFSLDPDDGSAWLDEGHKAFGRLWERVKLDVGWGKPVKTDLRSVRAFIAWRTYGRGATSFAVVVKNAKR